MADSKYSRTNTNTKYKYNYENTTKNSWPIKPRNFGHKKCQIELHSIRYKKLVQENMAHAQETCTSLWYKIIQHVLRLWET